METKIKWMQNGFKVNGALVKGRMHLSSRVDGSRVLCFYAEEYGAAVPADLRAHLGVTNKTDTMTDYFEHDHFDISPAHAEFAPAMKAYIAKCTSLVKVCKNPVWKQGREKTLAEAIAFAG